MGFLNRLLYSGSSSQAGCNGARKNGSISLHRIDGVRGQESHGGTLIFSAADPGKTLGSELALNLP
jgi:hypothetical protein